MRDVVAECLAVKRGAALGIATPANRVLWALVKLLDGKRA
jgi:2-dehydropantoate 2-reductase